MDGELNFFLGDRKNQITEKETASLKVNYCYNNKDRPILCPSQKITESFKIKLMTSINVNVTRAGK